MYELKPEDARELARLFGEEDSAEELEAIKKEQARQRLELLKIKTERERHKLKQENEPRPEPQKGGKNGRTDAAYIISIIITFASVLVSFLFMLTILKKF